MSIDDVVDRTVILNQQKHERMSNNNDCRREESLVLNLTKIRVKKNGSNSKERMVTLSYLKWLPVFSLFGTYANKV
jgi:hypothetical protein